MNPMVSSSSSPNHHHHHHHHHHHRFILYILLLLSIPLLLLVAPSSLLPTKTLPPIPDSDEADDLALFRRATLSDAAPLHPLRPPPPTPKIAFLFLTNSPLSFSPLWELFFSGHSHLLNVYVHSDPDQQPLPLPTTPSFRLRSVPSKSTQRSSPTLISAARRLLAAALLDDPANAFFALLSQHCVPLHSFRFLYRSLLASPHRSSIQILSTDPVLHDRYVARGDNAMLPEVPFEKFRMGSQFFVLTRHHALLVVRDRRLWKKFKLPCLKARKDSCYPEEHYFPTLLDMQDPEGCTGYTLTRVNWTESVGGHPHMYQPPEISAELIRELRRSNSTYSHLFARKFSPDCLDPLLALAESVIFRD